MALNLTGLLGYSACMPELPLVLQLTTGLQPEGMR
jgi:hypothetical protein